MDFIAYPKLNKGDVTKMDDNTFIIIDENGEETPHELLFVFEDPTTNKTYIIYTDNTEDEEGNTNTYASVINVDEENPTLYSVESAEEWNMIEAMLEDFQKEQEWLYIS